MFIPKIIIALEDFITAFHPVSNCTSFTKKLDLSSYNATVRNVTEYPVNSYNISTTFNNIAFCEITAAVSYGDNDTLISTVWLPSNVKDYQQRFLAIGNSGMAGKTDFINMLAQLNSGKGFAIAAGDGGHRAAENNNGNGSPGTYLPYLHDQDQVEAWLHNGISLFTPTAKALAQAFYGNMPKHSYYAGCSTGGAQGFSLAQFHPDLFDAIYAGSPGNYYSHLALSFLWNALHTNTTNTMPTQAELNFTTKAVLDACDTLDGVKDRLIENPLACHFDINTLACNSSNPSPSSTATASSTPTCLPPSKISAMKSIYAGPRRSDNSQQIYPGFSLGGENSWQLQLGSLASSFSIPILQNLVYNDLKYNASTFNWASDVDLLATRAGQHIDAISPDLSTFFGRGGRMITTQGWSDQYNAATWPIEHRAQLGDSVDDFYRLFMIPGGGHCNLPTYYRHVPTQYFLQVAEALIAWVEGDQAPESITSDSPPDGTNTTRRLCAWPKTAKFMGGNVDRAESYTCG